MHYCIIKSEPLGPNLAKTNVMTPDRGAPSFRGGRQGRQAADVLHEGVQVVMLLEKNYVAISTWESGIFCLNIWLKYAVEIFRPNIPLEYSRHILAASINLGYATCHVIQVMKIHPTNIRCKYS